MKVNCRCGEEALYIANGCPTCKNHLGETVTREMEELETYYQQRWRRAMNNTQPKRVIARISVSRIN